MTWFSQILPPGETTFQWHSTSCVYLLNRCLIFLSKMLDVSKILILAQLPLKENITFHLESKQYGNIRGATYSALEPRLNWDAYPSFRHTICRMGCAKTYVVNSKALRSTGCGARKWTLHLAQTPTATKTSTMGENQATESNLPFAGGSLQMKITGRFQRTAFKWNV